MKKLISVIAILLMLSAYTAGCSLFESRSDSNNQTGKVSNNTTASSVSTSMPELTGNAASSTSVVEKVDWRTAIYYPDSASLYIQKEQKTFIIPANAALEYKVNVCMEELINTPRTSIPKNTRVLSASLEQDTLKLNLSKEFEQDFNGGSAAINMALGQIVLTFTEFPDVNEVFFLIDGNVLQDFKGHVEFDRAYMRTEYEQFLSK